MEPMKSDHYKQLIALTVISKYYCFLLSEYTCIGKTIPWPLPSLMNTRIYWEMTFLGFVPTEQSKIFINDLTINK
jgi:hypothetical protein